MISFIIIGRNEEQWLESCIKSVLETAKFRKTNHYEVIYVDAGSVDNSIEIALKFEEVNVYLLETDTSAAAARNAGVSVAQGDILFLVDADMKIFPSFLFKVLDKYDLSKFVLTGQYIYKYYNWEGEFIKKDTFYKPIEKDRIVRVAGSTAMIISKKNWDIAKGMKTIYKKAGGEDFDFLLTLAKNGIKTIRLKSFIGIHHTISYTDNKRIWKRLLDGSDIQSRSVLYRKHLFNLNAWIVAIKHDYSVGVLFFTMLGAIFFTPFFIFPYFVIIATRSIRKATDFMNGVNLFSYHFLRDIMLVLAFFLYFPKENPVKVKQIK